MAFHSIRSTSYSIKNTKEPYHILTINTNWRKLPYILDKLRDENFDIRRAHIRKDESTFYMKNTESPGEYMNDIIFDGYHDHYNRDKIGSIVLPTDTEVLLYNIPKLQKTTLEFSCKDRLGLLSDVLDLLLTFPYELHEGIISTVGPYAHNLFYLRKQNRSLQDPDMEYISNVFEYEVKKRKNFIEDSHPSQ